MQTRDSASYRWPRWSPYAFAIIVTVATLLIRLNLIEFLGEDQELILYMIPISFTAYLGGLGPGLVATLGISAGVAYYYATHSLLENRKDRASH